MRSAVVSLALVLAAAVAHPADNVWLDVDTSIGLPRGEVDDGLALIQAFHSPELAIRGISVVFGNASLEEAAPRRPGVVGSARTIGSHAHRPVRGWRGRARGGR